MFQSAGLDWGYEAEIPISQLAKEWLDSNEFNYHQTTFSYNVLVLTKEKAEEIEKAWETSLVIRVIKEQIRI